MNQEIKSKVLRAEHEKTKLAMTSENQQFLSENSKRYATRNDM
jgi:hypothetical protein